MKALDVILIILLLAAIVAGVFIGIDGNRDMDAARSALAESEKSVEQLRDDLTDLNLKYRGVLESRVNIPDSVRNTSTGQWLQVSRNYAKRIKGLEADVREAERQNRKHERALAEVRGELTRRFILVGGALVLTAGALIARRAFRS